MANSVTSTTDHNDIRVVRIVWDTSLTAGTVFQVGGASTGFDFSRCSHIRVLPISSVGTIATTPYTFAICETNDGTNSPCLLADSAGHSGRASIGTGTPAAATRTAGYVHAPVRFLHLALISAGTGLTSVTFDIVGYARR